MQAVQYWQLREDSPARRAGREQLGDGGKGAGKTVVRPLAKHQQRKGHDGTIRCRYRMHRQDDL